MISEQDFHLFLQDVVNECFPNEKENYSLEGRDLVGELYKQVDIRQSRRHLEGDSRFALSPDMALKIGELLLSTFTAALNALKMLQEARAKKASSEAEARRVVAPEVLKLTWKTELEKSGLPSDKAEEIVTKFTEQFSDLITSRSDSR